MPLAGLFRLGDVWRKRTRGARRWLLVSVGVGLMLAAAHLARFGTDLTRGVAAGVVLLSLLLWGLWWRRERRVALSPRRLIERVIASYDAELAQRAQRALGLVERSERTSFAGSPALARTHLERLVARASLQRVEDAARQRATTYSMLAGALGLTATLVLALGPMRVVEGLDVLFARGGRAPVPISWLAQVEVRAHPPSYLRRAERVLYWEGLSAAPVGTLVTVRGTARFAGRQLVLTDGAREVPFVEDGNGGVVARFTVERDAELRAAARFGAVLIDAPESLSLRAVADEPPKVNLSFRNAEGKAVPAPSKLELAKLDRLELDYEVSDDNGLRQLDLVMYANGREERRVLSRFDGETRSERGAHALKGSDPFLRRMFLPIVLRVEARDGDPVTGPKWGRSQPITLIPPTVGQAEAERLQALLSVRDDVTDVVAWRTSSELESDPKSRAERAARAHALVKRVSERADEVATSSYGGLEVPDGLESFMLGQVRVLQRRTPRGASSTRQAEDVLLALDVSFRRFSTAEAKSVSVRLGGVAEEVAAAASAARDAEDPQASEARLVSALDALDAGAHQLSKLGALGADIGSVALADIGRIKRSRTTGTLSQLEAAARHLAARLRHPNPSFGSARSGGVESGGVSQEAGEPSRADDRFNQLADELGQLAREHAGSISDVQRTMSDAEQAVDLKHLEADAQQRADALRKAMSGLPMAGANPGSARAAAALAREHGEAMAQSMSKLSLADAVESGKSALQALKDAARKRDGSIESQAQVEQAEAAVKRELEWAKKALARLKDDAGANAKTKLGEAGRREQALARRAGNLGARGKEGETALPQDATDALERAEAAMRDAAKALGKGDGDRALELQREAQRLLEQASKGQTSGGSRGEGRNPSTQSSANSKAMQKGGEVPERSKAERAEEFRRRVMQGLGQSKAGRMSPAVKRYAESLLR